MNRQLRFNKKLIDALPERILQYLAQATARMRVTVVWSQLLIRFATNRSFPGLRTAFSIGQSR